ncbi:cyclic AMP-dependent transcription factor ATF-6 beta isoform X2 [Rhinatrema bivittatum]|uniref:cyclic AMP-dependent transcription factor ATF-6 beta isoform X2 n=1 Tax=Rhinatrema bivittatum TaxID=194408 RepID=UPI00112CB66D|nr:cyclic AMP-dependent transcription factor ATF-6 beta isoform X2 [Rhinatrema bivittatum]
MGTELYISELDSRFFRDNLLSNEDWDASLYNYMEDMEEQTRLLQCFDENALFDSSMDPGLDPRAPASPWSLVNGDIFPEMQVKSEPVSPSSSHCSDSSLSSSSSDVPQQISSVKLEQSLAPPCLFGDVLSPPLTAVQISVVPVQESRRAAAGKSATQRKASGLVSRKPAIQPKPMLMSSVPIAPQASSPTKAILVQTLPSSSPSALPQPLPVKPSLTVPAPPVVLAQAELLPLPVPGLVKAQAAKGGAGKAARTGVVPPSKTEAKNIVPAPGPPPAPCAPEIDEKKLKRQQRMIKNRESACQSRRRKKEYLQGLESRLQEALCENERLHRENALLRKRLEGALAENTELKFGSGNRKVVCVMVLLLFIAFNFGPVSISERKAQPLKTEALHSSRHLLEFREERRQQQQRSEETVAYEQTLGGSGHSLRFRNISAGVSDVKELVLRDLDQLFLSSDCRQFNRTESLRLADELSGWVRRHQIVRKPSRPRRARAVKKVQQQKKTLSLSRYLPAHSPREPPGQLQLYRGLDQTYEEFLGAIDRREDTFYVVSFRRDHLLLPAISHNKTTRPKMSLVMPAMALNESAYNSSRRYEAMMQIDCEVMDTRVIQIKSSTVPPFLRQERGDNRTAPAAAAAFHRGARSHRMPLSAPSKGSLSFLLEDKEEERGDGEE